MLTIHKYQILHLGCSVLIDMPAPAGVIHAGEQDGYLTLWAIVDTDADEMIREVVIYGTGHELGVVGSYIDTVQMSNGLVWHVFYGVDYVQNR